jgi:ATP-dependent DNA ligase
MDCHYEYKKSKQFLKYKPLMDDEFQIVDFIKSISGDTLGSFVCKLPDGRTFSVNPKGELGTDKKRKEIWDDKESYRYLFLTVEFLEYTKDGIPRLPRAKAFRKGKSID